MKIILFIFILTGCATLKEPPLETGRWEFDKRLTYQSLYDKNGGMKPIKSIDGDLYIPTRYEFHFNRKYFDFDRHELVVIGYLDNGEYETQKVVPIKVTERSFDHLKISYTTYYGEPEVVTMQKTEGCYYIRNEDDFNEYYCQSESGT